MSIKTPKPYPLPKYHNGTRQARRRRAVARSSFVPSDESSISLSGTMRNTFRARCPTTGSPSHRAFFMPAHYQEREIDVLKKSTPHSYIDAVATPAFSSYAGMAGADIGAG